MYILVLSFISQNILYIFDNTKYFILIKQIYRFISYHMLDYKIRRYLLDFEETPN